MSQDSSEPSDSPRERDEGTLGHLTDWVDALGIAMIETTREVSYVIETTVDQHSTIQRRLDELEAEVKALRRLVERGPMEAGRSETQTVPVPRAFDGSQDPKQLKEFFRDMDQLWWCRRSEYTPAVDLIESWDQLKAAMKERFQSREQQWEARSALSILSQTSTVRDYVDKFSTLMEDIDDMSAKDQFFHFTIGLRPWAQAKLRSQDVRTIQDALLAVEQLVEPLPSNLQWGEVVESEIARGEGSSRGGPVRRSPTICHPGRPRQVAPKDKRQVECSLCRGPHFMRDCPQRAAIIDLQQNNHRDDRQPAQHRERGSLGALQLVRHITAEQYENIVQSEAVVVWRIGQTNRIKRPWWSNVDEDRVAQQERCQGATKLTMTAARIVVDREYWSVPRDHRDDRQTVSQQMDRDMPMDPDRGKNMMARGTPWYNQDCTTVRRGAEVPQALGKAIVEVEAETRNPLANSAAGRLAAQLATVLPKDRSGKELTLLPMSVNDETKHSVALDERGSLAGNRRKITWGKEQDRDVTSHWWCQRFNRLVERQNFKTKSRTDRNRFYAKPKIGRLVVTPAGAAETKQAGCGSPWL
eukprot:Gb_38064 [translate_table: standard]